MSTVKNEMLTPLYKIWPQIRIGSLWYWTSTPSLMLRSMRACISVSNGTHFREADGDNIETINYQELKLDKA